MYSRQFMIEYETYPRTRVEDTIKINYNVLQIDTVHLSLFGVFGNFF